MGVGSSGRRGEFGGGGSLCHSAISVLLLPG